MKSLDSKVLAMAMMHNKSFRRGLAFGVPMGLALWTLIFAFYLWCVS